MKKFAVIDVGSNSVRLMLVADGNVLYKALNTTRLGEGLAKNSRLQKDAILRTATAVAQFSQRAKEEGATDVFAFATASVRSAENGNEFLKTAKALSGVNVEVISGEEEAELGILGALGKEDGAVLDVGGASTEIVVKKAGAIVYKKSIDVGVVRIKDKFGRDKCVIEKGLIQEINTLLDCPKIKTVIGIGGTATTLATLTLGLKEYDSNQVTGARISRAKMSALADKLSKTPVSEIETYPCMPKGRADVLSGGAVWIALLMKELGIENMRVSDKDNLEGFAIKRGLLR